MNRPGPQATIMHKTGTITLKHRLIPSDAIGSGMSRFGGLID